MFVVVVVDSFSSKVNEPKIPPICIRILISQFSAKELGKQIKRIKE